MCGIVAYLGKGNAVPVLIQGLKRLEYRGYDSSGISLVIPADPANETSGKWVQSVRKRVGKVDDLCRLLEERPVQGSLGIGHTR